MGAALNGILLHGGTRGYIGTFFVFADYVKPAMRVAALSKLPTIMFIRMILLLLGKMVQLMNQLSN